MKTFLIYSFLILNIPIALIVYFVGILINFLILFFKGIFNLIPMYFGFLSSITRDLKRKKKIK